MKQMFPGVKASEEFMTGELMTKRPEQLSIQQFIELTNLTEAELIKVGLIQK